MWWMKIKLKLCACCCQSNTVCVNGFGLTCCSLFSVWNPVLVIRFDLGSLIRITWCAGNGQSLCVLASILLILFVLTLKIIVKISAFLSVRHPFSARRLLRQQCISAKWPSDPQSYFCIHFLPVGFLSSRPYPLWWMHLFFSNYHLFSVRNMIGGNWSAN